MEICVQTNLKRSTDEDKFYLVYSILNDPAEAMECIEELPHDSYITLVAPLVDIDEREYPEIEHWFENYEDADFWNEPEIYGWDIYDLIAAIRAAIENPDSDDNPLAAAFHPSNRAGEIEAYVEKMGRLLVRLELIADINNRLIMRHAVYY